MKSKVYFIRVNQGETNSCVITKLERLIAKSGVLGCVRGGSRVAVKMHFGEEGNTGFVDPAYVRVVCDSIMHQGALPFLADTNTLYRGKRMVCRDHLELAAIHGFTKEATGAEVVIPDDAIPENTVSVAVNTRYISLAKVARIFIDADAIIAVSHFKGHMLSGFGGAIKNLAMGCATRSGKLAQHCDVAPVVSFSACTGCGACQKVCPAAAIQIENGKSVVNKSLCIGCATCIAVCPTGAMAVDFNAGTVMQEKMAAYAYAVLKGKETRSGFINFALKINKECDCWGADNWSIAPDAGIFASFDPVAVDKASFDTINQACGKDIFRETHPAQDALRQLECARELGLGSLDYELITL